MKMTALRLDVLCNHLTELEDSIIEYQELRAEVIQELSTIQFLGWTPKTIVHLLNVTVETKGLRHRADGPRSLIH